MPCITLIQAQALDRHKGLKLFRVKRWGLAKLKICKAKLIFWSNRDGGLGLGLGIVVVIHVCVVGGPWEAPMWREAPWVKPGRSSIPRRNRES